MKYQTMRIDHLKHLNIEALIGNVELTVNGETLTIKPVAPEKKPRTKVEYVKVKSVFELDRDLMNNGDYGWKSESGDFHPSQNEVELVGSLTRNGLYRQIETPMTEREVFVDWFEHIHEVYVGSEEYDHGQLGEFLFDNGCKLVN